MTSIDAGDAQGQGGNGGNVSLPMEFTRPPKRRWRWWHWMLVAAAVGVGALLVAFGLYVVALAGKVYRGELGPGQLGSLAGRSVRPTPAEATGVNRPTIGDPEASVVVVEFLDFQCPFCRQAEAVVDQMLRLPEFAGKVRFIFRHFPLVSVHPNALDAARAAECANAQGKFAPMRTILFANQDKLSPSDLSRYGEQAGLDRGQFLACRSSVSSYASVEQDWRDGLALGVNGTPTYFVGGEKIEGVPTVAKLQQAIARQLTQRQRE